MKILEKMSKKKRQLIIVSKQKPSINKSESKIIVISILNNSKKKGLLISIPETELSIPVTKELDIAMIDADVYCTACKLKRAQVFDISIGDLEY